jgi:hypothetical protein
MKKTILIITGLLISICALVIIGSIQAENTLAKINSQGKDIFRDGDIIFQTSESQQCEAVRIATNSKFSHCGIIYKIDGEDFVYEAVQPVKITPLKDWIFHGKGNNYVVKRLKDSRVLNNKVLEKMKSYGKQFRDKDYDLYFEWSDNRIYCSELVWKIYKNGANIELCNLESLKSFNLSDPKVKAILAERYGHQIPLEEKVVAPSQIEGSKLLITVIDTYK